MKLFKKKGIDYDIRITLEDFKKLTKEKIKEYSSTCKYIITDDDDEEIQNSYLIIQNNLGIRITYGRLEWCTEYTEDDLILFKIRDYIRDNPNNVTLYDNPHSFSCGGDHYQIIDKTNCSNTYTYIIINNNYKFDCNSDVCGEIYFYIKFLWEEKSDDNKEETIKKLKIKYETSQKENKGTN